MLVEGAFGRVAAMFEWGTALKGPFRDLSKLFPALGARGGDPRVWLINDLATQDTRERNQEAKTQELKNKPWSFVQADVVYVTSVKSSECRVETQTGASPTAVLKLLPGSHKSRGSNQKACAWQGGRARGVGAELCRERACHRLVFVPPGPESVAAVACSGELDYLWASSFGGGRAVLNLAVLLARRDTAAGKCVAPLGA
ncbi:hypothetical protein Y1Q_0005669 [Alligator mississippiensis]|uniref:Uncharacterized protein n=1 Tax=Alligator mississippiensis TaxID=8496 RepID=A0A151MFF7_ALLMI|nr:hypothetical protein Y1Q_0005669 [Alligator mississippiensis]